jgi:predicted dehydrogenase
MPIRLGVIGLGYAGMQHVRAAAADERFALVATAERSPRADLVLPDGIKLCSDWRELIDARMLDAVSICLPHHLHADVTEAALQAGLHVLLEKPIAGCIAEARGIVEASARSRGLLMIEMTHRFYPPIVRARQMVQEGWVGRIIAIEDRIVEPIGELSPWLLNRAAAGGGVALTSGVHMLDRILWVCDQPLQFHGGVAGWTQSLGDVEDTAAMQLSLEDGTPVCFLASWPRRPGAPDDELTIYASKGTLRVWAWRGWRFEPHEASALEEECYPRDYPQIERAAVGIRAALAAFGDAIGSNASSPVPAAEVLRGQELIQQFYDFVGRK